jgi:hypothetical protein
MKSRAVLRWSALLVGLGLVLTSPCWGYAVYVRLVPQWRVEREAVPFDPEGWQKTDPRASDLRFRMLPDLVRQHRLIGWSRAEVEQLLGRPYLDGVSGDPPEWLYWLGPARDGYGDWGFPWLVVEFGDGAVVRVGQLEGLGAVAAGVTRQE